MNFAHQIGHALYMAFAMFWEILWPLILGFFLSGVVQAVVSKAKISKTLGDDRPKTIAVATSLGDLAGPKLGETLADYLIMLLVLVPYFAFRVLDDRLGSGTLRRMFFVERAPTVRESRASNSPLA